MCKWLLIFLFPLISFTQEVNQEHYYLSLKPKLGFLAAHRGTMGHLPQQSCRGAELSVYKRFSNDKYWKNAYRNPYGGLTLYGSTVGNNAVLGQAFGAYGFLEFPFAENRFHVLTFKISSGLGYITKVFDQEENPKNVAVSTHINALICLGLQGRIKLGAKHQLLYSIDMTHLSNGSYQVPNLGLNMPYVGLGYAYNFKSVERSVYAPDTLPAIRPRWLKNWNFTALAIVSAKEVFPTGEKKYPVYALSLSERKIFRPKVGMELSLDLISKQAIYGYKSYIPKNQWKIFQVGIFAGYVLPLDKFHFVLGMGAYVKDRYNPDNGLYHRLGMRYQFGNGLIANLTLKAHWAKADYVEWGIGYTFKHKR